MPELLASVRAREILGQFSNTTLIVVGDVMLDQFVVGRVDRISPEAPVPVLQFDHAEQRVGGSANVAHNIRTLGGRVELVGVVGRDEEGGFVRKELTRLGIGGDGLLEDSSRHTTKKVRLVTTRNQQVARIDYETDEEIGSRMAEDLAAALDRVASRAAAFIVSDYAKGTVTQRLGQHVIHLGSRRGAPVLIDPKLPHLEYYTGATVITPNHFEAEAATQTRIRGDADVRSAARALRDRTRCGAVLITRGEHGMWLYDGSVDCHLPAAAREVADVTGAGDTVVATLGLALACGATLREGAILANAAAGVTVGKFGPATLSQQELREALDPTARNSEYRIQKTE